MLNRSGVFAVDRIECLHVASTDGELSDKLKSSFPEANGEGHLPHEH